MNGHLLIFRIISHLLLLRTLLALRAATRLLKSLRQTHARAAAAVIPRYYYVEDGKPKYAPDENYRAFETVAKKYVENDMAKVSLALAQLRSFQEQHSCGVYGGD